MDKKIFALCLTVSFCSIFFVGLIGILPILITVIMFISFKITNKNRDKANFSSKEPFPYVVIENNNILFANSEFKKVFGLGKFSGPKDINSFIPEIDIHTDNQPINYNGKYYLTKIVVYLDEGEKKEYRYVYFIEGAKSLTEEKQRYKTAVALIFIDNYDEVINSVEDIKRPLLSASIDRKLTAMAQHVGGVVRKFEKDRYLFIFTEDNLNNLKEKKFEILSQVREIEMGNKSPVTLSVGIGVNGRTIAESMKFASAAIDLSLGRGGDQVAIKDNEKYDFYGGTVKENGNTARVKARVKAYALTELIEGASNVVVMGHRNQDLDCLGAAIGVYKIADGLGKKCNIILDEVTTNIKGLVVRLSEIDEYKNNVFINSNNIDTIIEKNTLLIVVDCHRPTITENQKVLSKIGKVVVFDHHRKSVEYISNPVLTYHEPYASSTCELITEMIQYVKIPINFASVEADALLAGITVDTKNFVFKTGAKTFESAALLKRKGADSIRVKQLFKSDMGAYRAKVDVINNAKFHYNGDIAISICTSKIENPMLITAQAADELLTISEVEASFVLCKVDDLIVISARSLGKINVQLIMEHLNGGGHQMVAGAQIKNSTIENALIDLNKAIEVYMAKNKN